MFDAASNPVASDNLVVGNQYQTRARIYNRSNFNADNTQVTFKWADYGTAQRTWNNIDTASINVPANNNTEAVVNWAPPITGHYP